MVQQLHILKCPHASGIEVNQLRQVDSHLASINVYDPPRIRHFAETPKDKVIVPQFWGSHTRDTVSQMKQLSTVKGQKRWRGHLVLRSSSHKVIFFPPELYSRFSFGIILCRVCVSGSPISQCIPPSPLVIHQLVSTQL